MGPSLSLGVDGTPGTGAGPAEPNKALDCQSDRCRGLAVSAPGNWQAARVSHCGTGSDGSALRSQTVRLSHRFLFQAQASEYEHIKREYELKFTDSVESFIFLLKHVVVVEIIFWIVLRFKPGHTLLPSTLST